MALSPFLAAGPRRQRVTLQRATETADPESGQLLPGWVDLGTYWASVETLGGQEKVIATQLRADNSHKVTLGYVRDDITAKDRLTFNGTVLNITNVNDIDFRHVTLELLCAQVTTGQTT